MKFNRIIVLLLLCVTLSFARDGMEIYQAECASCHTLEPVFDKERLKMMKERMQNMPERMQKRMKERMKSMMGDVKAPAMKVVSGRLKKFITTEEAFITFSKDYIKNPSRDKGHCVDEIYEMFGTMPAVTHLSDEELGTVSKWLYEEF